MHIVYIVLKIYQIFAKNREGAIQNSKIKSSLIMTESKKLYIVACSANYQLLNLGPLFSDLAWEQYGGLRKPFSGL